MIQDINEIARFAARFDLPQLGAVGEHMIYALDEDWKVAMLAREPSMAVVSTLFELEQALAEMECESIFIPKFSFGQVALMRVLERHDTGKPIYWQGTWKNEQ